MQPTAAFSKHSRAVDRLQSWCKDCQNELRQANYWDNLTRERGKSAVAMERDPEHQRRRALMKRYGMTLEDFEERSRAQDGKCGLCGDAPPKGLLFVDHDHATGKVRSLLCPRCNAGVGYLEGRLWLVDRLLSYFEAHA